MYPKPLSYIIALLVAFCVLHRTHATRGSRFVVHNDEPNLLRIVSSTITNDYDAVYFLRPNSSLTFAGFNNGKGDDQDAVDVTFTLQRYYTTYILLLTHHHQQVLPWHYRPIKEHSERPVPRPGLCGAEQPLGGVAVDENKFAVLLLPSSDNRI